MTIFEKIKASVTPKEAAERYGVRLASNNMIRCPFHNDRHPSMKLNAVKDLLAIGTVQDLEERIGRTRKEDGNG